MSPVEGAAAVILAGGAGTRLWPLSRSATPKHLLRLVGDRTLLRSTYERARLVADRVLVVTEASQLEACRRELPELADEDWIAEPGRRGTAACLALAAASLPADGLMLSLHADHLIPDSAAFASTARAALRLAARSGSLGTIGVRPTGPSTGFGYIHLGEPVEGAPAGDGDGAPAGDVAVPSAEGREAAAPPRAFRALGFVEKPPLA
ncbi:MAG TPA: sugar phosphate nucleotidyltransferase, partial [Candidatus Dormibacteraeota bacterium]|nr:sugar phosphate nucleotidyltransferase [Candidatus Dormibacteraeota bacterium]